jgi:hypothetical protein
MKITHKQLEACLVSPKSWVATKQAQGGPIKLGYTRALSLAICEFHKDGKLSEANKKVDGYVAKNFKDVKKIAELYQNLIDYAKWFEASGIIPADTNITIAFPYNAAWQLGGIVGRVDFLASGYYRAVLFEPIELNWTKQLRMPLIQAAVAEKYGRPASEVRVGFQELNGNVLADTLYKSVARSEALSEFNSLGLKVSKLMQKANP